MKKGYTAQASRPLHHTDTEPDLSSSPPLVAASSLPRLLLVSDVFYPRAHVLRRGLAEHWDVLQCHYDAAAALVVGEALSVALLGPRIWHRREFQQVLRALCAAAIPILDIAERGPVDGLRLRRANAVRARRPATRLVAQLAEVRGRHLTP